MIQQLKDTVERVGWYLYDIGYAVRYFTQRRVRGYSSRDLKKLDYHLATLILPRLRAFRTENTYAIPGNLYTLAEWHAILDQMIEGFAAVVTYDDNPYLWEEKDAKIERGLSLFARHYSYLFM